jgi:hypothetical protein
MTPGARRLSSDGNSIPGKLNMDLDPTRFNPVDKPLVKLLTTGSVTLTIVDN